MKIYHISKFVIENLAKSKSQLILKSQIDKQQKLIESETSKLNEKILAKENLIGHTCEKYAKQRVNDHYIGRSFLKMKYFKRLYIQKKNMMN